MLTTSVAIAVSGKPVTDLSIPYFFVANVGLWIGYGLGPLLTSRRLGRGPVADFGASVELKDVAPGLALGAFTQVVLIWLLYWPLLHWQFLRTLIGEDPGESARELFDLANGPVDVILLSLMVVVIAPLVEELFFRGLLLSALRYHLGDGFGIALSAGLFALIHLQRASIPGLFLFGVIAAVLRIKSDRLGPAWFFHSGFNAATVISLLAPWENL